MLKYVIIIMIKGFSIEVKKDDKINLKSQYFFEYFDNLEDLSKITECFRLMY